MGRGTGERAKLVNPTTEEVLAETSTEGIDYMTSSSSQSTSSVKLTLRLNADGDKALTEVLSKVNQVRNVLPRQANDPVVVKTTGDAFALMYIGFNSDVLTPAQVTGLIDIVPRTPK